MKGAHLGRTNSPCYGCQERSAECHPACERYKKFTEIHDKERAEIHKKQRIETFGYGAQYRTRREFNNQVRNVKSVFSSSTRRGG